MLSWPALLLAPLVALTQLSIAYSLVTPACAHQNHGTLHVVAALSLLLVIIMTALAWREWRGHAGSTAGSGAVPVSSADGVGASQRPHFVALIGVLVGALSALVSIALWLPIWFLSPCY
jgi:hypothetical protein